MITKIKWKDHPILGNLELDLTDPNNKPYNTIVFAGENGTGKTTILETISSFLNLGSFAPFDYLEYCIEGSNFRVYCDDKVKFKELGFHKRKKLNTEEEKEITSNKNNRPESISADVDDIRRYGIAYSKARSGFITKAVRSTTTQQIDQDKYEQDNSDDFTYIKQLLVDIDTQDNSNLKDAFEKGEIKNLDDYNNSFVKNTKTYRFKNAFNEFFDDIEYKRIDNDSKDEKKVIFSKNGHDISVDDLSTGEKQIVFRGSQLLRNSKNMSGGVVLIDEPELSMHPKWQKRILDYYRNLFKDGDKQIVQMFFATHSEYVLQSALIDINNVLVVVLTEKNGMIESRRITAPNVLPTITAAETNYLAFGVSSTDYHIELYGYLQSKTCNHKVSDCDQYIAQQPQYNPAKHERIDSYNNQNYTTLPTYIRNAIDHPDSNRAFTPEELNDSIALLIELCR